MPIVTLVILFYTITIDFIVILPTTPSSIDTLLIIIDKFTKRVLLISGNEI